MALTGVFGRKPIKPVSTSEFSPELREALVQLGRLREHRPELGTIAKLYEQLLPLLFGSVRPVMLRELSSERMAEKLANGIPLLRGESLEFGETSLNASWRDLGALVARFRAIPSAQQTAEARSMQKIMPADALRQVLNAGPDEFRNKLEHSDGESARMMSSLRFWALPLLEPVARALEPNWLQRGWQYGYCPACGSWPLLAEFRGLEQFRWLRCGLCASGWQVDRIFCPFCETRDHRQLQDLFVEDRDQKCRVTVCDGCRGFVRGIATLTTLTAPGLLVAEVETLHLELLAQARGYTLSSS